MSLRVCPLMGFSFDKSVLKTYGDSSNSSSAWFCITLEPMHEIKSMMVSRNALIGQMIEILDNNDLADKNCLINRLSLVQSDSTLGAKKYLTVPSSLGNSKSIESGKFSPNETVTDSRLPKILLSGTRYVRLY